MTVLEPGGDVIALVKPQFQVGPDQVGKGGVVRDLEVRREAVRALVRDAQELGFERVAEADSVITGIMEIFYSNRKRDCMSKQNFDFWIPEP